MLDRQLVVFPRQRHLRRNQWSRYGLHETDCGGDNVRREKIHEVVEETHYVSSVTQLIPTSRFEAPDAPVTTISSRLLPVVASMLMAGEIVVSVPLVDTACVLPTTDPSTLIWIVHEPAERVRDAVDAYLLFEQPGYEDGAV